jgi:hypothetical protein
MTARAVAMSAAAEPLPHPDRARLPRWLGLVFPPQMFLAAGFAAVYAVNRTWMPFVISGTATVALGLAAGFAVRRAMPGRAGVLRVLTVIVAVTIGLLALGLLTGGQAGIGPLVIPSPRADWAALDQIFAAMAAAWLALRAWAPPLDLVARWRGVTDNIGAGADGAGPVRGFERIRAGLTRAREWAYSGRGGAAPGPQAESQPPRPPSPRPPRFRLVAPRRLRRARAKRAAAVHVLAVEEQRCPYCLEVVQPHDPRGVKICSICRASHHADCWAITGTCQVGHYQGDIH